MANFADSNLDLTEIAGRHGIIADQASCTAGWDPLSSSGRRRFWHVQLHFSAQACHLQAPCRCAAMALRFQPFESVSATAFLVIYQLPRIMDTGDIASFAGRTADADGTCRGERDNERCSWRNVVKCIMRHGAAGAFPVLLLGCAAVFPLPFAWWHFHPLPLFGAAFSFSAGWCCIPSFGAVLLFPPVFVGATANWRAKWGCTSRSGRTLVLGERVQQRTAEHHENPLCEETIELLRQIMSKRGQQQTVEQIVDVFGRHLRGGDVGPTCATASTDR